MRPAVYRGGTKAGPDRAAEIEPRERCTSLGEFKRLIETIDNILSNWSITAKYWPQFSESSDLAVLPAVQHHANLAYDSSVDLGKWTKPQLGNYR